MNSDISLAYWTRYFGWLSFQMLLIGGIAGILSKFITSARVQVTLYRGAMLSLLFLVVASFLGFNQINLNIPSSIPENKLQTQITAIPLKDWHTTDSNFAISTRVSDYNAINNQSIYLNSNNLWFPIWIWAVGTMVMLLRIAIFQQKILRFHPNVKVDPTLEEMIHRLSTLLNLIQKPQMVCIPELPTPVALGWRKAIIGIPNNFAHQYTEPQQRVVLLHELAHIKSQDPLWHLISYLITAICWWHPVSWWIQRRMRHASEIAADEASQLLDDGASTLAECLVMLGNSTSLTMKQVWISIAGNRFKSGLAQRVYRLLNLKSGNWNLGSGKLHGIMAVEFMLLCSISIFIASCFTPKSLAGTPPINLSSSLAGKMLAALATDKALDSKIAQEELRSYRIDQAVMRQFLEKRRINISDKEISTSSALFVKYFESGGLKLSKANYVYRDAVLMGCVRASKNELDAAEKVLGISSVETNPIVNDPKAAVNSRVYELNRDFISSFIQSVESVMGPFGSRIPNVATLAPHFFNNLLGITFSEGDPKWNATLADLSKAAKKNPRGLYIIFRDDSRALAVRGTESQLNLIQQVMTVLNALPAQIMIESKFIEVPENTSQTLELLKTGDGGTNFLSNTQYRELLRQLDRNNGADILSAPRVVTVNGRQAQISISQIQSIVFPENMDFPPAISTKSGAIQMEHPFGDSRVTELTYPEVNTNSALHIKKTTLGINLDVIPVVLRDNSIEITMIPTIADFLGYLDSGKDKNLKKPKFRTFQTTIKTAIFEGQALVCGPIFYSKGLGNNASDNQWRISSLGKRALYLIVTAQCIEPAKPK